MYIYICIYYVYFIIRHGVGYNNYISLITRHGFDCKYYVYFNETWC